jgi:hypothetical protein
MNNFESSGSKENPNNSTEILSAEVDSFLTEMEKVSEIGSSMEHSKVWEKACGLVEGDTETPLVEIGLAI